MASLVLLLSFLVRTTKIKNQDSIVSSKSFDIIEDDSCLNAKWSNYESELEENIILHESKVCIYLV
jgi:hypothetical protein